MFVNKSFISSAPHLLKSGEHMTLSNRIHIIIQFGQLKTNSIIVIFILLLLSIRTLNFLLSKEQF